MGKSSSSNPSRLGGVQSAQVERQSPKSDPFGSLSDGFWDAPIDTFAQYYAHEPPQSKPPTQKGTKSKSASVISLSSRGSDSSVNKPSRVRKRLDVDLTDSAGSRPAKARKSNEESRPAKARKSNEASESSGEFHTAVKMYPPKVKVSAPGAISRPEHDTRGYRQLGGEELDMDQFPKGNQELVRDIVWHGMSPQGIDVSKDNKECDKATIDTINMLKTEEWMSLMNGEQVMGDITYQIAALVTNSWPEVVVLDGYAVTKITNDGEPGALEGRKRELVLQKYRDAGKIVFCENVGTEDGNRGKGWHWRVLVYDKATRKLTNWDPLRKEGDRRDHGGKVAGYLRDFIRRHDLGEVDEDTPNQQNIPRQPDGSSCGAYCALYMLANAVKKPLPPKVTSFDAREFTGNAVLRGLQMKTVAAKQAFLRGLKFT